MKVEAIEVETDAKITEEPLILSTTYDNTDVEVEAIEVIVPDITDEETEAKITDEPSTLSTTTDNTENELEVIVSNEAMIMKEPSFPTTVKDSKVRIILIFP